MRISDWSSDVCSSDLGPARTGDLNHHTIESREPVFMELRRVAIVSPIRTAVGKFGGALAPLTAGDLGAAVIRALVEKSGIDAERVDDVVFGQGYASGEAPSIGRWSWLAAGLPPPVPGLQLDRRCGSGLQALIEAAMRTEELTSELPSQMRN